MRILLFLMFAVLAACGQQSSDGSDNDKTYSAKEFVSDYYEVADTQALSKDGIRMAYRSREEGRSEEGYEISASHFRYKGRKYSKEESKKYFAADIQNRLNVLEGYLAKYSSHFRLEKPDGSGSTEMVLKPEVVADVQAQIKALKDALNNPDVLFPRE